MKNQYFGDINDYRKYGLIRAIIEVTNARMLIGWMLTPDDGSTDGKFISYLDDPERWSHHDPDLFHRLKDLLANGGARNVRLLDGTNLLPSSTGFTDIVPDAVTARLKWSQSLLEKSNHCDFVFLDPDNGLEVKSKPLGGRCRIRKKTYGKHLV